MPRCPTLAAIVLTLLTVAEPCPAQWVAQESGTKARLRGVSVVGPEVAWASGAGGTVLMTLDGGKTWKPRPVPDASGLDFRDVVAIDARTAYLLAIGEGEKSRIFKTKDGGTSWTLQLTNRDPKGFLDALAFWDADHGLALGDPVDGRFTIVTTDDGGKTWVKSGIEGMPPALPREGAFAASGTCLITQGHHNAFFATGGANVARVFRSRDRGRTWTASETPIRAGSATSGIFSLAFRDADHGVIVGGSYDRPDLGGRIVATSDDGGTTWKSSEGPNPQGFRSAVAYLDRPNRLVTVGPSGSDLSNDGGKSWKPLGPLGFHAVNFAGPDAGWAVGEEGRIARFQIQP